MIETMKGFLEENWPKVKKFLLETYDDFQNVWIYKPNVLIWCAVAFLIALIY
tara:strand:- start:3653 stop:3808 length:156 start_codon:yes stop_codon:yes gene_type:complete